MLATPRGRRGLPIDLHLHRETAPFRQYQLIQPAFSQMEVRLIGNPNGKWEEFVCMVA